MVKKMFIRFDRIHERDGRTDTARVARRLRPRLCIAPRDKNRDATTPSADLQSFVLLCMQFIVVAGSPLWISVLVSHAHFRRRRRHRVVVEDRSVAPV